MKIYIVSFFFLVFANTLSWGQDKYKANLQSFTTEDGLSHLEVYCFEKDNRGVLWIGTRDGLNRFDGKNFKSFSIKNKLTHKSINLLYRDKDFLWCIHRDRRTNLDLLSIFHTIKEKVLTLEEHLGKKLLFKQNEIERIYKVSNTLFIKTQIGKLYSYTSQDGLKSLPFIKEGEEIKAVLKNGDYWVLDLTKRYFFLKKLDKQGKELFCIEKKEISSSEKLNFIYQSQENVSYFGYSPIDKIRLWFVIDMQGNFKAEEASFFFEKEKQIPLLSYYSKFHKKKNAYWYSVFDTCALLGLDKEILYKDFLKVKDSRYSFLDKNSVWIAHQSNGFVRLDFKKNRFTNLFLKQRGSFRGITKIKDKIYVNSFNHILRTDTLFKQTEMYPFQGLAILKDKENNLWGFKDKHLVKYDANLTKLAYYDIAYVGETPAWSIYEDKNALIWYSDIGLKSFNPKTKELKKFISNEFPEIEKSIVYHFYQKDDGTIFLCTTTGLYQMELEKGIIARYWSGGKGKYYLPADDFRHLYFDKSNQSYWLATNETGLVRWNTKNQTSKAYTFNHKAANIIHAVYADDFGFLWLSTENGIIQFEKKTGEFKVFSTQDGTSTHEFNRISHFQDKNGRIYFGGISGVTTFEPNDFYKDFARVGNTEILLVEISQFKENAQEAENVTAEFFEKKQLNFYPNDRYLTFIFALTDYKYSQDAIYYYKIKGLDKNWIKIQNNEITLSGMPYGKQILEVKVLLVNGKYAKKNLEIPMLIHKPFYLEWWFFVLSFLSILGITLLYIRYRTQKFELQKVALEKEVKKRTLKIEKAKEIIEEDKKTIEKQAQKLIELDKVKSRFFTNVSHELRTPITLIKAPIQSLIKKEKLSEKGNYLLQKAAENTDNLLTLVNEILDLTKLDNQKLKLEEEKVLLYNFIRQILSNFQSIAQMQDIEMTLDYQAHKELQILLDKDKFRKILNNLLSNALKFTPAKGEITITVEDLTSKMFLKVADTGRGIPQEDIPYVFERYFQSSQNNKAEGGLGIGLALSMELVKLCKGKMWLESSTELENQGTTFFVEFRKREVLNMLSTQNVLDIEKDFSIQKKNENSRKKVLLNKKAEKTVLIVEDNKDLRDYLSFTLSVHYKVLTAENGQKAIEILAKGEIPNLIISDLMMPVMDGYEFLEAVKNNEHWAGLPFIMLTARATPQDKLKALRIGVDDYITKPFEEEELLVRIKNLLQNYAERINFIQLERKNTGSLQNKEEEKSSLSVGLEDRKWLADFENLVLENLTSSLFSIDYLAELMKIGRTSLYQKVKLFTGLSPNQYIQAIRLKIGKDLLEKQSYNTAREVANEVGFKNSRHFGDLFKQEYGKHPKDYFV